VNVFELACFRQEVRIQQPNHDYGYNSVITHQQAPAAVTFNCMLELACVYQ